MAVLRSDVLNRDVRRLSLIEDVYLNAIVNIHIVNGALWLLYTI